MSFHIENGKDRPDKKGRVTEGCCHRPGEMRPGLRGRTDGEKWVDSRYFRDKVKRTCSVVMFSKMGKGEGRN